MAGEKIKSFLRENVPGFEKIISPAKKSRHSISEELLEPWQKELIERRYGVKLDESSTFGGAIEELTKPVKTKQKGVYEFRISMNEIKEALEENVDLLSPESRELFEKDSDYFVGDLFFHHPDKGISWDIKKALAASPVIAAALIWAAPGTYEYLQGGGRTESVSSEKKVETRITYETPYEKLISAMKKEKDTDKLKELVEKHEGNFPDLAALYHAANNFIWGKKGLDFELLEKILSKTNIPKPEEYYIAEPHISMLIRDIGYYITSDKIKDKKDVVARGHNLQKNLLDRISTISYLDFAFNYSSGRLPQQLKQEMYQKMTSPLRVVADVVAVLKHNMEKKASYEPIVKRLQSAKAEGVLLNRNEIITITTYFPHEKAGVSLSTRKEILRSLIDIADPNLSEQLAQLLLSYSHGLADIQTELIEKSSAAGWRIDNTQDVFRFIRNVGSNEALQKKIVEITQTNDERAPDFLMLRDLKNSMRPNLFTALIKEKLNPAWRLLDEFDAAGDEDSKIIILKKIKEWSESAKKSDERKYYDFWSNNSRVFFEQARKMQRLQEVFLNFAPKNAILRIARDETFRLDREEDSGQYDKVRAQAKDYIAPFLYAMIAQGQELNNTSVFEVLYNELKSKLSQYGGLEKFLDTADSEGTLKSRFILTLSFFGKLGELVTDEKSAEHWGQTIAGFFTGNEAGANSIFLTPTLENIFSGSAPKPKNYLEKKFLELAKKSPPDSKEGQIFELILAQYGDKFSKETKEEASQLSAKARESFEKYFSIPVKDWIDEKGILQSQMFFHPDHAYHFARLLEMAEEEGYKVVNR
ncbi:MAG: hypothetical protein G01um101444_408, partial [Parcubacteria group bacterium Gr01-1014_44]